MVALYSADIPSEPSRIVSPKKTGVRARTAATTAPTAAPTAGCDGNYAGGRMAMEDSTLVDGCAGPLLCAESFPVKEL